MFSISFGITESVMKFTPKVLVEALMIPSNTVLIKKNRTLMYDLVYNPVC